MEKPISLRKAIQTALPEFTDNPDRLRLYIDGGEVKPNKGTLSYQVHYTLNIFVQEFAKDPAYLNIAIIDWLQRHQPDIIGPHEQNQKPFIFEAEPLESDRWDILIELKLSEHIIVRRNEKGELAFKPIQEPQYNTDRTLGKFAQMLGVENDNQIKVSP